MTWWQQLRSGNRLKREFDAELRDHVERQVADHVRTGMSAREARRHAVDRRGLAARLSPQPTLQGGQRASPRVDPCHRYW